MLLYAITGGDSATDGGRALDERVRAWTLAGVDYIQVREKALPLPELGRLVRGVTRAVAGVPGARTRVIVNVSTLPPEAKPMEFALECGAHGIHLGGGALRNSQPGWATGSGLVSVACHSPEDCALGRDLEADLAIFAPVFEKVLAGTASLDGVGLRALALACKAAAALPVIALGGVTAENSRACLGAGAAGVAGIRLFADVSADASWRQLTRNQAARLPGSG